MHSVKYHLKRYIGETLLSYEEFSTLHAQIESVLNLRPIVPLTDNCNDELALTPAHFLIRESSLLLAEHLIVDEKVSPLERWKRVIQITQSFLKKWSNEYLQALQRRTKRKNINENIKINDIVIIKNENVPPSQWPLAKVIKTHPGADGNVRVASLKTANQESVRPSGH